MHRPNSVGNLAGQCGLVFRLNGPSLAYAVFEAVNDLNPFPDPSKSRGSRCEDPITIAVALWLSLSIRY